MSVRILELPGLAARGDLYDWLEGRGCLAEPPAGGDGWTEDAEAGLRRRQADAVLDLEALAGEVEAEYAPREWLDGHLAGALARAAVLEGAERDGAVTDIFGRLADAWGGLPAVTRGRLKDEVTRKLAIGRKIFEAVLWDAVQARGVYGNPSGEAGKFNDLVAAFLSDLAPERYVRRWREEWYVWTRGGGCYVRWSDERMRAEVNNWLCGRGVDVTVTVSRNFLNAMLGPCFLDEATRPPTWLGAARAGTWVALRNGLLNIGTEGQRPEVTIPHSPDFFSLVCLPFDFDPEAACAGWRRAVERWHPAADVELSEMALLTEETAVIGKDEAGETMVQSRECQVLLQEFMGYLLEPENPHQVFMLNLGEGNDGKSQYMQVAEALVGEKNFSSVGLEAFDPRNRFGLWPILGKVLNCVGDANDLDRVGEGALKQIVGGDWITIDRKNKPPVTDRLGIKFIMNANQLPSFRDRSEGIWRRLLLVMWEHPMRKDEEIQGFAEGLIRDEMPGIFNWALDGFLRVRKQGFTRGPICSRVVADARRKVHKERVFFDDCLDFDPEGAKAGTVRAYSEDVVAAYKHWADRWNIKKSLYGDNLMNEVRRWVKRGWPAVYRELEARRVPGSRLRGRDGGGARRRFYRGVVIVGDEREGELPEM